MNKNTKRLLAAARKSAKAGNDSYNVEVPSSGFHNSPKGAYQVRRIPNVKYVHKPKTTQGKPSKFPKVCAESDEMPLSRQREIFYGSRAK